MNLAKKLFDLQSVDSEIQRKQSLISEIDWRLQNNEILNNLKRELDRIEDEIIVVDRSKKDLEWETADIQNVIKQINTKLYGGVIKNPKELLSFEQEVKALKAKLQVKEDELLDIMDKEEDLIKQRHLAEQRFLSTDTEWSNEKDKLIADRRIMEDQLITLNMQREQHILSIDETAVRLYEKIIGKKGLAVVRVEQGKCQGCRLSISMSEMQRARGGSLVQCSSCGMILYL